MTIEDRLLALMEGHDAKTQKTIEEAAADALVGTKFIIAHKKDGQGSVIVSGPYGQEDNTEADEKSFVDHPDYSSVETKPYEQCKDCAWYHGAAINEAKEIKGMVGIDEEGEEKKKQADNVDETPAVVIENPLNPDLDSSEKKESEEMKEAVDYKKVFEVLSEAKKEGKIGAEWTPFSQTDWYGFGGAQDIAPGRPPEILNHGNWTLVHSGEGNPEHGMSSIQAMYFHPNESEHPAHLPNAYFGDHVNILQGETRHVDAMKHPKHIIGMLKALEKSGDLKEEHIQEFLKEEELSEEFQLKASTLFAAKLNEAVEAKTSTLQEEFRVKLDEAIASHEQGLIEKIDGYFETLSEKWMQDNEVALEATIRSELTESFIEGVLQVCKTHAIDLPIEKRDVVKTLEEQLQEANRKLEQAQVDLNESVIELNEATREIVLEEMTKGMTLMDSNKFKAIMEDFDFESKSNFTARCEVIKESFFKKPEITKKPESAAQPLVESKEDKKPSKIAGYASYIKKHTPR